MEQSSQQQGPGTPTYIQPVVMMPPMYAVPVVEAQGSSPQGMGWGGCGSGGYAAPAGPTDNTGSLNSKWSTICFRNLPNNYTVEMVLDLLDSNGFKGYYDFVYLPHDFKRLPSLVNIGYFFVNFKAPEAANYAWMQFDNFQRWSVNSSKILKATWAKETQGLKACISRYRNSPVMHKKIPNECKPLIFENGQLVPLRTSKKKVREPRVKADAASTVDSTVDTGNSLLEDATECTNDGTGSAEIAEGTIEVEFVCWDGPEDHNSEDEEARRESQPEPRRPSNLEAAVRWAPNADTSVCYQCSLEFNQKRRAHRCRACGNLCCAMCAPLTADKSVDESSVSIFKRLCSGCVDKIEWSADANPEGVMPSQEATYETKNTFVEVKEKDADSGDEQERKPVTWF